MRDAPEHAPRVLVVGAGVSGLMAAIQLAQEGTPVSLFSILPPARSDASSFGGGFSAALPSFAGDTFEAHFNDTVAGGDYLANQEPVYRMCREAPELFALCERLGVPFNRSGEDLLELCPSEGMAARRTAYAGGRTGQALLRALEAQAMRLSEQGLIRLYSGWEMISAVLDGAGTCRGIVVMHRHNMEVRAFRADAVIVCSGGLSALYGASTQSVLADGGVASRLYQQGASLANVEFIQMNPLAIKGGSKPAAIPPAALSQGGRFWVRREGGDPWYFAEEGLSALKNLSPSFQVARSVHRVLYDLNLGVEEKPMAYVDLSPVPASAMERLEALLQTAREQLDLDAARLPIPVFPAPSYSMGGLWVDEKHATSVAGVFAAGECQYQYHGASVLEGNILLSSLFGARCAARSARQYASGLSKTAVDFPQSLYDQMTRQELLQNRDYLDRAGNENPYRLAAELGEGMTENAGLARHNSRLKRMDEKIQELSERFRKVALPDRGNWANQPLLAMRALKNKLELARAVTVSALTRNESRGFHFKPEYPRRDDDRFLKTTKVSWQESGPRVAYEDVDLKYLKPSAGGGFDGKAVS